MNNIMYVKLNRIFKEREKKLLQLLTNKKQKTRLASFCAKKKQDLSAMNWGEKKENWREEDIGRQK